MFDFTDQVVVVTGAGGNLGNALASAFDAAQATLVLVDHRPGRLEAAFPAFVDSPRHHLAAPLDLAKADQVEAMVAAVLGRFGRIDVLVNGAGGYAGGKPVAEAGLDLWEDMWNRNLRTALIVTRAVLSSMLAAQRGSIINVGSKHVEKGGPNSAAYSAAKTAVLRLTESTAAEVKTQGVRVNCVLPSTIDAPENRAANPKADPSKWVQPESLAGVILFLASPLARDITGAALPVYGRV